LSTAENQISKLELYPNPVENTAFLKAAKSVKEITIFSIDGRNIQTLHGFNLMSLKIDFSAFIKGVYILNIQYKDGSSESMKLIKK
jgi:hypothetical protein